MAKSSRACTRGSLHLLAQVGDDQPVERSLARLVQPSNQLAAAGAILDLPGVAGEPAPVGLGRADRDHPLGEGEAADAPAPAVRVHALVLVAAADLDARRRRGD